MAAAPALLDVLKEMVKDAVFTELCQSIGEEPEWLKKARREIAKVEVA
jgi:hypothetical protein